MLISLRHPRIEFCRDLCREIGKIGPAFNDLKLQCGPDPQDVLLCNRLLLGSISGTVKACLADRPVLGEAQPTTIILPEFTRSEIESFLTSVLDAFNSNVDPNLDLQVTQKLAKALDIKTDLSCNKEQDPREPLPEPSLLPDADDLQGFSVDEDPDFQELSGEFHTDSDEFLDDISVKEEQLEDSIVQDEDQWKSTKSVPRKRGRPSKGSNATTTAQNPRKRRKLASKSYDNDDIIDTDDCNEEDFDIDDLDEGGDDDDEYKPSLPDTGSKPNANAYIPVGVGGIRKQRNRYGRNTRQQEQLVATFDREEIRRLGLIMTKPERHVLGDVRVMVSDEVGQKRRLRCRLKKAYFRCMIGVKGSISDPHCVARPLCWSDQPTESILGAFENTREVLQHLYGFSEGEMTHNTVFTNRMEEAPSETNIRIKDKVIKENKLVPKEMLGAKLEAANDVVAQLEVRTEQKDTIEFAHEDSLILELDENLPVSEMNSVAIILWFRQDGPVKFYPMDRSASADECLKVIFDVWCTTTKRLPECPALIDMYRAVMEKFIRRDALQALISGPHKEKSCPVCGKTYPYMTTGNRQTFTRHLKDHERESFDCDCGIEFKSLVEKRKHNMVFHSDGKYKACEQCSWVGYANGLQSHMDTHHKEYICDVCGKKSSNQTAAICHSTVHKVYKCSICDEEVVGKMKFKSHVDKKHHGQFPCDECDAVFDCRVNQAKHVLLNHKRKRETPYHCEMCGKAFPDGSRLRRHITLVHTTDTPFPCRYGCGESFNDSRKRVKHEKKVHGALYTKRTTLQEEVEDK